MDNFFNHRCTLLQSFLTYLIINERNFQKRSQEPIETLNIYTKQGIQRNRIDELACFLLCFPKNLRTSTAIKNMLLVASYVNHFNFIFILTNPCFDHNKRPMIIKLTSP